MISISSRGYFRAQRLLVVCGGSPAASLGLEFLFKRSNPLNEFTFAEPL